MIFHRPSAIFVRFVTPQVFLSQQLQSRMEVLLMITVRNARKASLPEQVDALLVTNVVSGIIVAVLVSLNDNMTTLVIPTPLMNRSVINARTKPHSSPALHGVI